LGAGIHPLTDERADSQLRLMVRPGGELKVEVPAIGGTRGERTTAGLMPLGLFLFIILFWWSLAPDLRLSLGQTNTRRLFRCTS